MQEITIAQEDSRTFAGWLSPATTRGPGILLLSEIFGVNTYIRVLADRLAGLGFPTMAPDIYWRQQPRVALGYTESERSVAFTLYRDFNVELSVGDVVRALEVLRTRPECDGRVAILGYCLGGLLAVLAGGRGSPEAVVAYYGVGIERHLDTLRQITCAALLHFGDHDTHVPPEAIAAIQTTAAAAPAIDVVIYPDAGHAFANEMRPDFYRPEAAHAADERTIQLLRRTFG